MDLCIISVTVLGILIGAPIGVFIGLWIINMVCR